MNLTHNQYNSSLVLEAITDTKEIDKRFRVSLKKFLEAHKNTLNGSMTISYGGRPVRALPADIVRIASELKHSDLSDLLIRNIILNFIISSEKHSAYSGVLLMDMLRGTFLSEKLTFCRRVETSHLNRLIAMHVGQGICSQIILKILEINPNSSLEFKVSRERQDFCVVSDYSMKISGFVPAGFSSSGGSLKGYYPVFIDGKVESVSEIDSLLRTSHSNGQTILLMARDFSPDVINTLDHNYVNKKLKVVPFVYTEEGHEKLVKESIFVIDTENYFSLNTFDTGELKKAYDGNISRGCIHFHGAKGVDRHITIVIPGHFRRQAGLIEDRIRGCMTFALEVAKSGIMLDANNQPIAGKKQFDAAVKVHESMKNFHNELGGLIVLE